MADGIKARLQRFSLFNAKPEQKYVSLFLCMGLSVGFVHFSCRAKWEVEVSAVSHRSEHRALKLAREVSISVI